MSYRTCIGASVPAGLQAMEEFSALKLGECALTLLPTDHAEAVAVAARRRSAPFRVGMRHLAWFQRRYRKEPPMKIAGLVALSLAACVAGCMSGEKPAVAPLTGNEVAAVPQSRIVFREGFDGTGRRSQGCTEVCSIDEAPPSLKTLAFRPADNKPADAYQGFCALPKASLGCSDYEFSFRFSFPRDSKKAFTLTLVSGDAADKKSRSSTVFTISEKAMNIRPAAAGLLPAFGGNDQELDIRPMLNGLWQQALIRKQGRTVELLVENDGRLRKFAQAEVADTPLIGFNLSGATAVDFDDIEIRRIAPAPVEDFREGEGVKVATRAAEYRMDVPEGVTSAAASFCIGTYPGAMVLRIGYADGSERVIDVKTTFEKYARSVQREVNELDANGKLVPTMKTVKENVNLTDAGLVFKERPPKGVRSSWGLTLHTRPNLRYRYNPDRELQIVAQWESYPAASAKFVRMELRPDEKGAQLWLDGRYAGRFDGGARVASLGFVLPANGAVRDMAVTAKPFSERYQVLDVNWIANPGALAGAKPSLVGGQTVSGVPFVVADGPGNADTGVCRENLGSFALECDGYLDRSAFDGMRESLLLSVPVAQYTRAWALCAVEDDPDKVSVVTARITRLGGVGGARGPAIADTSVTLPPTGEPLPPGVTKAGEVDAEGKLLPLYLVEFKLDIGAIQDVIFQEYDEKGKSKAPGRSDLTMGPYLDFEVLGKCNDRDNFYINRERKPSDDISGVHVFAATLERSPVEVQFLPARESNTYQPGETAAMKATLRALWPAECRLEWTVADNDGKPLGRGAKDFSFAKSGETDEFTVALDQKDFGWYSVNFKFTEKSGRPILEHRAYYALIDKDKRKAGYESPYFAWWPWAHGMVADKETVAEVFARAGIRKTMVKSEQDMLPRKFTLGQFPWFRSRTTDPQQRDKELTDKIKSQLAAFPHTDEAIIFHESGGGPYPLELLGGKTEISPEEAQKDKTMSERAEAYAKAWRQNAPGVRLVVGNSGDGLGLLARLFRSKYPREYIDAIGEESVGLTMPPERSVAVNYWALKKLAALYGYDLPVEACYEWKCRVPRHLGLARCAEWTARDALIALAWGNRVICVAGATEPANSYYNTVWGAGGFTRYPQFYPYPSYPAIAALTQTLDCARFSRMVPTGSLSVYALEFKRDNEFILALWTARGALDATVEMENDGAITRTELYGRVSTLKTDAGRLVVPVGEAPVYLSSSVAVKLISVPPERSFPREQRPVDAGIAIVNAMDKVEDWKLDTAVDPRIDVPAKAPVDNTSFRRPGKYELRAAKDDRKGDCLELELLKTGDCPALMQEYAFLKLAKPVETAGVPSTIGLWVKGNSSWGKVLWEIEDAEGEKWLSAGTHGYGCNVYDWPELAGINYDG